MASRKSKRSRRRNRKPSKKGGAKARVRKTADSGESSTEASAVAASPEAAVARPTVEKEREPVEDVLETPNERADEDVKVIEKPAEPRLEELADAQVSIQSETVILEQRTEEKSVSVRLTREVVTWRENTWEPDKECPEAEHEPESPEATVTASPRRGERKSAIVGTFLLVVGCAIIMWAQGDFPWGRDAGFETAGLGATTVETLAGITDLPEAPPSIQEVEALLRAYLAAADVEALLETVREPLIVRQRLETFHSRHPLLPRTLDSLEFLAQQEEEGLRYYLAKAVILEGMEEERFFIVHDGSRGWRVDWETQVVYNPMTWEELREDRPTEKLEVRVMASRGDYYDGPFANADTYLCIELREPQGESVLFGYMERGSIRANALSELLDRRGATPLMVKLRYPKKARSDLQVFLTEVVGFSWLRVPEQGS